MLQIIGMATAWRYVPGKQIEFKVRSAIAPLISGRILRLICATTARMDPAQANHAAKRG